MSSKKAKKKKIEFTSNKVEEVLLPGRRACNCQALGHELINNCLFCGRIVCEQEGEGPCMFCGNIVLDQKNLKFPSMQKDISSEHNEEKMKAIEHRDKLLSYEKSDMARKNIIDEQTDWYSIADDIWQKNENRDIAVKKLLNDKNKQEEDNKKIHIGFEEGGFVEKTPFDYALKAKEEAKIFLEKMNNEKKEETLEDKIRALQKENEKKEDMLLDEINVDVKDGGIWEVDPKVCREGTKAELAYNLIKEQFNSLYKPAPKKAKNEQIICKRVLHDDVFEQFESAYASMNPQKASSENDFDEEIFSLNTDKGKCLSMKQPWASFLIEGIKRFEGRHWNTPYRGPLWIHASSAVPTEETIKSVEMQYKEFYKDVLVKIQFPNRYPTGCLLGMVDLQCSFDKKRYKNLIDERFREDNDSDYLFVVRNPRKLRYPIKMGGNKDIFNIDEDLRKVSIKTNWWPYIVSKLNLLEDFEENAGANILTLSKEEEQEYIKKGQVTIKKTFFGFHILNILKIAEINEIITNFTNKMEDKKAFELKNAKEIDLDITFPFLENIINVIPESKKNIVGEIKKSYFFFIGNKTKEFAFDKDSLMVLSFGSTVELVFEIKNDIAARNEKMKNGSMIILNDYLLKYYKIVENVDKNLISTFRKEFLNLFVVFSK